MTALDAGVRMDRMYRLQRHVYDLTRKYYLLGRDRLIQTLDAGPGERYVEVGCGTARNLVRAARRYPAARWYGVEPSAAMLRTAGATLRRTGLEQRITLVHGDAVSFDPGPDCGLDRPPDGIWFSYALSMIPEWRAALDHAAALLPPGGTLHVVDFGDLAGLPPPFTRLLDGWLTRFEVTRRPEAIADHLRALQGTLEATALYRGYGLLLRFQKA
ncbi:class I SAM-dependent methyltransferase [Thiohalorhabdus methylotrophus]|uniref:Class I SAM-dependent methyltransferase n=1 Tax=Thiohalorhabdus methylotrophus TaxID=3242694 RepID=A0ABV4TSG6_9GAMM